MLIILRAASYEMFCIWAVTPKYAIYSCNPLTSKLFGSKQSFQHACEPGPDMDEERAPKALKGECTTNFLMPQAFRTH